MLEYGMREQDRDFFFRQANTDRGYVAEHKRNAMYWGLGTVGLAVVVFVMHGIPANLTIDVLLAGGGVKTLYETAKAIDGAPKRR